MAWTGFAAERATGPAATLDALVTAAAAWTVQLGLGWLTVLVALLLVDLLRSAGTASLTTYAGCPASLRRFLLLLCGVAVAGSLAAPSFADAGPGAPAPDGTTTRPPTSLVDGLPLPDRVDQVAPKSRPQSRPDSRPDSRPEGRPGTSREVAPRSEQPETRPSTKSHDQRAPVAPRARRDTTDRPGRVVVRAGDCLWDLARDALVAAGDPAPTAAAVDHAWRAIYTANRSAVGADPGLLLPGTVLRIPGPVQEQENHR